MDQSQSTHVQKFIDKKEEKNTVKWCYILLIVVFSILHINEVGDMLVVETDPRIVNPCLWVKICLNVLGSK